MYIIHVVLFLLIAGTSQFPMICWAFSVRRNIKETRQQRTQTRMVNSVEERKNASFCKKYIHLTYPVKVYSRRTYCTHDYRDILCVSILSLFVVTMNADWKEKMLAVLDDGFIRQPWIHYCCVKFYYLLLQYIERVFVLVWKCPGSRRYDAFRYCFSINFLRKILHPFLIDGRTGGSLLRNEAYICGV